MDNPEKQTGNIGHPRSRTKKNITTKQYTTRTPGGCEEQALSVSYERPAILLIYILIFIKYILFTLYL
jgi:hypothetical protein